MAISSHILILFHDLVVIALLMNLICGQCMFKNKPSGIVFLKPPSSLRRVHFSLAHEVIVSFSNILKKLPDPENSVCVVSNLSQLVTPSIRHSKSLLGLE